MKIQLVAPLTALRGEGVSKFSAVLALFFWAMAYPVQSGHFLASVLIMIFRNVTLMLKTWMSNGHFAVFGQKGQGHSQSFSLR